MKKYKLERMRKTLCMIQKIQRNACMEGVNIIIRVNTEIDDKDDLWLIDVEVLTTEWEELYNNGVTSYQDDEDVDSLIYNIKETIKTHTK